MIVCSDVYEGIPLLGVCHLYLIGSLWRKSFPHQYWRAVLISGGLRSDILSTQHPLVKAYPTRDLGKTSPHRRGPTGHRPYYGRLVLKPLLPDGRNRACC